MSKRPGERDDIAAAPRAIELQETSQFIQLRAHVRNLIQH
jgi:hypothetical protein